MSFGKSVSTDTLVSEKSLNGTNTTTTLYLVMFLAHFSKRLYKRGEKANDTPRAVEIFMSLVKTALCQAKENEFSAMECIMNIPMSKYKEPYICVSGVADERVGKNTIEAMGENYPHMLKNGCNSKQYTMHCATAFEYMIRVGNTPFNILLAVAALLDDALCQGSSVYHYKETDIGQGQRTKVTPQDRARAFGRFICAIPKGITNAMRRQKKPCDVPLFATDRTCAEDDTTGDDVYSGLLLGESQYCEGGDMVSENPVMYKNVLKEGAARLYVT